MPDKLGLTPYVVHATFQYSGTPGKRHRMRERLWWNVSWEGGGANKTPRLLPLCCLSAATAKAAPFP
jgi:hypothetical protein